MMSLLQVPGGVTGNTPPDCASSTLIDLFINGYMIKGWQCTMAGGDSGVLLTLGLIIFGGVGLATFISTGSLAIPAVLGVLLSGILLTVLPATPINILVIALVAVLSVGGLMMTLRFGGR
jgi:hypothetical protein